MKPGSASAVGRLVVGDRVADAGVGDLLDLRGDEADLARPERLGVRHFRAEDADPVDLVMGVGAHHLDALVLASALPSTTRTSTTTPR